MDPGYSILHVVVCAVIGLVVGGVIGFAFTDDLEFGKSGALAFAVSLGGLIVGGVAGVLAVSIPELGLYW